MTRRAMTDSERQHREAQRMMQAAAAEAAGAPEPGQDDAEAEPKRQIHEANMARWDHSPFDPTPEQAERARIAAQDARVAREIAWERVGEVDPVTGRWVVARDWREWP